MVATPNPIQFQDPEHQQLSNDIAQRDYIIHGELTSIRGTLDALKAGVNALLAAHNLNPIP